MSRMYTAAMVLAGVVAMGMSSCEDKGKEQAAGGLPPMPAAVVKTMKMHQQDVDLYSTWFGHLRGVEQAEIRPEVSGKLLRRVYKDGSLCQEGDVLFEIDPASYKAAVAQASASLEAAKAAVMQAEAANDQARQDVERYSGLVKSGSVSEKQYTDALQAARRSEALLAAARAQVQLSQAALDNATINLDRCTIRAPFTGLASASSASIGELLSASGPALTSMSSIDPIRVDFVVPEKQMTSKVLDANFDSADQKSPIQEFELLVGDAVFEHKGTVVAVDSQVNRNTGTVNFIGHVSNPQLKLRAGAAVRVRAKTGEVKDALLVPSRALLSSMNHRYIYVVAPDKTPIGIDVQPGVEVVLEMPNGDGSTVPMLMQVVTGTVKPIAETLKEHGIENVTEAEVIVEGSQMAQRYAQMNMTKQRMKAPGPAYLMAPEPFIYTTPTSTVPSVTSQSKSE